MKKVFLTAFAVSAIALSASAQGVSFGPRLGLNIAKASQTDGDAESEKEFNDAAKSRLGLNLGVALNLGITESFTVRPELLFSQQGYKSEESGADFEYEEKFRANYLQIPVLARYSFGSDDFKIFVNAGPYFGYWMSGKTESELIEGGETTTEKKDIEFDKEKDFVDYNRTDVGIVAGAGVGFGAVEVDVRYNLGLGNTINNEGDDKTKIVNRFWGVGVSYMFGND